MKGLLDLSQWDFEKDGTIKLDGEWEFYWKEFLDPRLNTPSAHYITVPGNWNNFIYNGKPVGGKGYATYRLLILFPKEFEERKNPIGIKIPSIGTAYELWIGNHFYGKGGKVSALEENAEHSYNPKLYWIRNEDFITEKDGSKILDILIKVSNYHNNSGGIWFSIKFGDYQNLSQKDNVQSIIDFFLFGSILIMSLYHFGLYYLRKKDPSALWFGIYCIAITLRILLTGEKYVNKIAPNHQSLLSFLEYLDFVLLVPASIYFLFYLFPEEIGRKIKNAFFRIGCFFTIPILILPEFY